MTSRGFLLRELVVRDLKTRYADSVFGFLWAFVNSLWQLGLYSLVFSLILKTPLVGEGTTSFPAFLFAGLLPWMAFSEGILRGTTAIVESGHLVKKLRFPSEILVLSVALSALIHSAIAFVAFLGVRMASGSVAWSALGVLAVGIAGQFAVTLGLGLLLAAGYVFLRDITHGVQLVVSALFYLTPLLYPAALVPERFQPVLLGNPLTPVVASYRAFLLGSAPPDSAALVGLAAWGVGALAVGYLAFRRVSGRFADEL